MLGLGRSMLGGLLSDLGLAGGGPARRDDRPASRAGSPSLRSVEPNDRRLVDGVYISGRVCSPDTGATTTSSGRRWYRGDPLRCRSCLLTRRAQSRWSLYTCRFETNGHDVRLGPIGISVNSAPTSLAVEVCEKHICLMPNQLTNRPVILNAKLASSSTLQDLIDKRRLARSSLGEQPYSFLNAAEKWELVAKPRDAAIALIERVSVSCSRRARMACKRRFRDDAATPPTVWKLL